VPDDLDREIEQLLRSDVLVRNLVNALNDTVFTEARRLFGDRAAPWIASTLRTTADVLERLDPGGRSPV
jgi:hypothetical protein